MTDAVYGIRGLRMKFGARTVLDMEDLVISRGTVTAVLGPNGSGKSTFLEILAFLLKPTAGNLVFGGTPVAYGTGGLAGLRRRVALVDQQPIMFTTTVERNVTFPLRIRGVGKAERKKRAAELLELVGMDGFKRARADKLSGGETKRVAIARALAAGPEVILLDEPTAGVDEKNREQIGYLIARLVDQLETTVVLATHDGPFAEKTAAARILLNTRAPSAG